MNEERLTGMPVRSLQQMLRAISFVTPGMPQIIPDGIFGSTTTEAVSTFQRMRGIPVTGIADEETFRAIVAAYDGAIEQLSPAQAPIVRFPATLVLRQGQSHPVVFLVQAMLLALGQTYPELGRCPVDGMLGKETAQMLEKIQGLSNLPVTGDLDLLSYNRLAQLFRGSFDRGQPPAYG